MKQNIEDYSNLKLNLYKEIRMEDMTRLSLQEVHFFKCLPSIVKKSIKSKKIVAIRGEMFMREGLALKFVSRILCNMFFA